MRLSEAGLNLIKSFESCRLVSYQDSGGLWTIGWGHTGPGIVEGLTWTQELADAMLIQDVAATEDEVNRLVSVPLTQGEFDALVSFAYNVGVGAMEHSTMLYLLNNNRHEEAANEFERWDKVHGVVVAGVLRRRMAEKDEFLGGLA
jgi:lysozyme